MADEPGAGYFNVHKYADGGGEGATAPAGSNYVSPSDVMADASAGQAMVVSFRHETYSSDWTEETVFGRTDPIQLFKQTTRRISLSLKVPAETVGEAYDNLGRISSLTQFLYPNYTQIGNAQSISQGPVLRLKVMNIIQNASTGGPPPVPEGEAQPAPNASFKSYKSSADASQGLMGVITSLTINHNLETSDIGVFQHATNTILSSMIEVSIDFTVLHESRLGWSGTNFDQPLFPYGVTPMSVEGEEDAAKRLEQSRRQEPDADPKTEQQRLAALKRYATLGGKARMKKDLIWLQKMNAKDQSKLTDQQKANMAYISETLSGAGIGDITLNHKDSGSKISKRMRGGQRDIAGQAYDELIG